MPQVTKFTFRTKHPELLKAVEKLAHDSRRSINRYIEYLLIKNIGENTNLLKKIDREAKNDPASA